MENEWATVTFGFDVPLMQSFPVGRPSPSCLSGQSASHGIGLMPSPSSVITHRTSHTHTQGADLLYEVEQVVLLVGVEP